MLLIKKFLEFISYFKKGKKEKIIKKIRVLIE